MIVYLFILLCFSVSRTYLFKNTGRLEYNIQLACTRLSTKRKHCNTYNTEKNNHFLVMRDQNIKYLYS